MGYVMYFMGIAFLGIVNFLIKDFAMTWPRPLPEAIQFLNPVMAYTTGIVLVIAAGFALAKRNIAMVSVIIACLILVLLTSRHLYNYWRDYINGFKSLVFVSGALLAYASTAIETRNKKVIHLLSFVAVFLFFTVCGYAHLAFSKFVQDLIPTFIPFRSFFTWFTGICLLLGGIGILIQKTRSLAALLSGIMIASWFFLLHLPRAFSQQQGYGEWTSVGESFAIAGICFMIYGISASVTEPARVNSVRNVL